MNINGFYSVSRKESNGTNFTQHGNLLGAIYHAFEKLETYLIEYLSLVDKELFDLLLSAICAVNLSFDDANVGLDAVYDLFKSYKEQTDQIVYSFIDLFDVTLNVFENGFLNTFRMNGSEGQISLNIYYTPGFGRAAAVPAPVPAAPKNTNGSWYNCHNFDARRIQYHNLALFNGGNVVGRFLKELPTSGAGNNCLINAISLAIREFSKDYSGASLGALNVMRAVCDNPDMIRRLLGIPNGEEIEYKMIPSIMTFLSNGLTEIPNIHIVLICIYSNCGSSCNAKFQLISNNYSRAADEIAIPIILRDHHYQAIKPHVQMPTSDLIKTLLMSYFNCDVDAKHNEIMSRLTLERIQYME